MPGNRTRRQKADIAAISYQSLKSTPSSLTNPLRCLVKSITSFDLAWRYWQVPLMEKVKENKAFSTWYYVFLYIWLPSKLISAKKNYSIVEQKCLTIKWALEALQYLLLVYSFRLNTDHALLQWVIKVRKLSWFLALQDFSSEVEHQAGFRQKIADVFSLEPTVWWLVFGNKGTKRGGGYVTSAPLGQRQCHRWDLPNA